MTPRPAKRVLLVGWDAADWQVIRPLLDAGKMPALKALVDSGVSGSLATLRPIISPLLWTSIATGKRADKHDILSFLEPVPGDQGGVRPVSSTSRKAKALWNILSQEGLRSCVVNWYASHPAEPIEGCVLSDRFQHTFNKENPERAALDPSAVHPPELLEIASMLQVHPLDLKPEQIAAFFGEKLPVTDDVRLQAIVRLLAECASTHNAATFFAEHEQWDLLAVYYDAIDHFGHGFMEYHPPAMTHVEPADAEIYGHVVESAYCLCDLMLARLLALVGSETTVLLLSDHGFYNDGQRPARPTTEEVARMGKSTGVNPLAWHRPQGILVAAGPGVRCDDLVHGASLLDITPTVLALLGLPVAEDMDGKVLTTMFADPIEPTRIASYEPAHPRDGVIRDASVEETDPWAARSALEQLAALGYIELPKDSDNPGESAAQAVHDRKNNLAQLLFAEGRTVEALAVLRELLAEKPDLPHIICRMALCLVELHQLPEAESLLRGVVERFPEMMLGPLLLGQMCVAKGDLEGARAWLDRVRGQSVRSPNFHILVGQIHLRQREWKAAADAFRQALDIDDDSAEAHDGLGVALRESGRLEDAVYEHMRAASLQHHRAQTHVNLGIALALSKQVDWAIRAFTIAAELAPTEPFPHRCLARIYRRAKDDKEKSREHFARAVALRRELKDKRPAFLSGA